MNDARDMAVPPLPEEIAGLFEWAHKVTTLPYNHRDYPGQTSAHIIKFANALRALVLENAEFVKAVNGFIEAEKRFIRRDAERQERIRELEAERDAIREGTKSIIRELKADRDEWKRAVELDHDLQLERHHAMVERDAIQAKTFEKCAKLMESDEFGWGDAAKAIRALAQTDKSKTESGE